MTDDEVQAVCERHDIDCVPSDMEGTGWYARTPRHGDCQYSADAWSEADAVCALLKTRYGIETQGNGRNWSASMWHPNGYDLFIGSFDTELAAVLVLADRLQQRAVG